LGVEDGGPLSVDGRGRLPHVPNGFNTPIEFTADFEYPGGVRVHVRSDPDFDENGLRVEGDASWLFVNRDRVGGPAFDERARRPLGRGDVRVHESGAWRSNQLTHHVRHFYACVRDGARPVSDVVSQHRAATACHLANISIRLGRKLTWDAGAEQFVDDPEADAMLSRPRRSPYLLPA